MEALDTYDAARLPVAAPASGVVAGNPNQRQRLFVELVRDETTIVSWKDLVRDATNEVVSVNSSDKTLVPEANSEVMSVDSSDKALVQEPNKEVVSPDGPDDYPVEEYVQVEKSRTEGSCSIVKRDKVQYKTCRKKSSKSSNIQGKKMRTNMMDYVTNDAHRELQKKKSVQHDLQSRSSMSTKVSPTISAETIKKEISFQILIFPVQTMHRFRWNLPKNPHLLPIHEIPPYCQPL